MQSGRDTVLPWRCCSARRDTKHVMEVGFDVDEDWPSLARVDGSCDNGGGRMWRRYGRHHDDRAGGNIAADYERVDDDNCRRSARLGAQGGCANRC